MQKQILLSEAKIDSQSLKLSETEKALDQLKEENKILKLQ